MESHTVETAAQRILRYAEHATGLLIVLVLLYVHGAIRRRTGALWRDEVSSADLVGLPSFVEMLRSHYWDSFPILWCIVLRGWMTLGFGDADFGLRLFGSVVGLAIVASLWWSGRRFGHGVPLISLVVFALSPTVFRYGDAVRGYGLGVLLLLCLLCAIWRLVQDPSPPRVLLAGLAALLAVQSLFANSPLLLAICVAGAAVCLRRRAFQAVLALLGIGLVALLSMLPYLRVIRIHSQWSTLLQGPVDLAWIANRFAEAVDSSFASMVWAWAVLVAITLAACSLRFFARSTTEADKDLALFVAVALLAGIACFTAYIDALRVHTQPWYYLPILALGAVLFDAGVHLLVRASTAGRILRLLAVVVLGVASTGKVKAALDLRYTNVDVVAAQLETLAASDDLIVVHPWVAGITFARYFHGSTPWMMVPDLDSSRFQPYGAFAERMGQAHPIRNELDRIAAALREGKRVWLAGGLNFVKTGEDPGELPPIPPDVSGWKIGEYTVSWSRQAAHLVQTRSRKITRVPLPAGLPVSEYEDLPLFVAEGWR